MIDKDGSLRCKFCNHQQLLEFRGYARWYCPKCRRYQIDDTDALPKVYYSYEVALLDKDK